MARQATRAVQDNLEPSLFLITLLSLVASAWEDRRWLAWSVIALCVATPLVITIIAPELRLSWPVWLLGIAFPAMAGLVIRRLVRVTAELAVARQELAERAVADERRRIGRDVHDLVGHGLAAVMLHVTGARHVLSRDPAAADDALRIAEEVGRDSMTELRRTVATLRADSPDTDAPPASLRQIRALAQTYASGGVNIEVHESGDLDSPSPAQALATYRIAQQALANAAEHAADARTVVTLDVTNSTITLDVHSDLAMRPAQIGTGHGIPSMRERARVAGGSFWAGPTEHGWSVRCELPAHSTDPEPDHVETDAAPAAEPAASQLTARTRAEHPTDTTASAT